MQALFSLDAGGNGELEGVFELTCSDAEPPPDADLAGRAAELAKAAWSRRPELDALIQSVSQHWDLPRMGGVDRAILRLAAHELLSEDRPGDAVIINEAIELAKTFGTSESPSFVNGILDAVRKRRDAPQPAAGNSGGRRLPSPAKDS